MTRLPVAAALRLVVALALLAAASPAARAQEQAVTPTRVIYPGQTVTPDALQVVTLRRPPRGVSAIVVVPEEITGKVARRTLLPGRLIPQGSVRDPYLVETGAPVTVTLVEGALTIALTAVPLQPGAAGDFIKLRNADSGVVFSGVVLADGTVRVGAL
ncbi:flagellar basal body P-ring formation chaperone FlgA [Aquibium sp. A9E412]|uniref:flagellar basal body P-ring formation chaperone FlgA n=1 Tax=Aquibium sp. A9E412 TaxID=2976767 RepID=UPI0025B0DF5B|nr:flagellar basal body P-ring formation chaperone FlgA [Aquibium sp. A9E412]MDN2566600.1 flagellar basal body P-ring formation chaperone FlgA [Aquibium sp. A9E412]